MTSSHAVPGIGHVQDEVASGVGFGLGPALPMQDRRPRRPDSGRDCHDPAADLHGLSRLTKPSTSDEDGAIVFVFMQNSSLAILDTLRKGWFLPFGRLNRPGPFSMSGLADCCQFACASRRSPALGSEHDKASSLTVLPRTGWRISGAISHNGIRTKFRRGQPGMRDNQELRLNQGLSLENIYRCRCPESLLRSGARHRGLDRFPSPRRGRRVEGGTDLEDLGSRTRAGRAWSTGSVS